MEMILLLLILLILIALTIIFLRRSHPNAEVTGLYGVIEDLQFKLAQLENNFKQDISIHRQESATIAQRNREELVRILKEFDREQNSRINGLREEQQRLTDKTIDQLEKINDLVKHTLIHIANQSQKDSAAMRESIAGSFREFGVIFEKNVVSFNELQRQKFAELGIKQDILVKNTEARLESIRITVEEKLEKTLSDRLGHSFDTVGKQLIEVQKGLGEMQTLAQDVGGLKKVLSNVKMRGGIGEVQLSMLLEQILAADQYESNIKTKQGSNELVEFAIKLPGRDEDNSQVWLPIDAKFPKDVYEQLQSAYDRGEPAEIENAQKNLDNTIRKMAKDISDKYIDPPHTTDFAIMFLPFEGIYAEVVRKASLLEELQRNNKVTVTGPTTLAAILNSLHIGFRTLAIQKRSSEVWKVLGAVKTEFEKFSGLMHKAQKNIQAGMDQLDDVMGRRTKAIQRKLRNVESLNPDETQQMIPELAASGLSDDGELD